MVCTFVVCSISFWTIYIATGHGGSQVATKEGSGKFAVPLFLGYISETQCFRRVWKPENKPKPTRKPRKVHRVRDFGYADDQAAKSHTHTYTLVQTMLAMAGGKSGAKMWNILRNCSDGPGLTQGWSCCDGTFLVEKKTKKIPRVNESMWNSKKNKDLKKERDNSNH